MIAYRSANCIPLNGIAQGPREWTVVGVHQNGEPKAKHRTNSSCQLNSDCESSRQVRTGGKSRERGPFSYIKLRDGCRCLRLNITKRSRKVAEQILGRTDRELLEADSRMLRSGPGGVGKSLFAIRRTVRHCKRCRATREP